MNKNEKTKINVKARFNRHLRIVKENIGSGTNSNIKERLTDHNYNIVLFCVFLILPIYPSLSSIVYGNNKTEFYRGNIDESSIIGSFNGGEIEGDNSYEELNTPILESTDSFISVNTILDDRRDLSGTNEIVDYEVKPGDSFSSIAYKFKVSISSILWANDFSKNHTLRPGEVVKVPPVTGLIHYVKSGDTISSLAKKYDTEAEKIIKQNGLEDGKKLVIGKIVVIPGAVKKIIKPVYKAPPKKTYTKTNSYKYAKPSVSQYVNKTGNYKLVWRKPYSGVWGNCTYYVASYKNVDWRGNANTWIRKAKAKGHATGSVPKVGAIVQFSGRGYNPRYGHVGIVMSVSKTHIIVSDMNYRRLNEVTYRKVPINDRSIDGYIYVN